MTIHGSDLPPGILAERFLEGFHQQLVERAFETRWERGGREYREFT